MATGHWPHDSSRCPECGYKQGDIHPDIQPCRLSARLALLEKVAEAARKLIEMEAYHTPPETYHEGSDGERVTSQFPHEYVQLLDAALAETEKP